MKQVLILLFLSLSINFCKAQTKSGILFSRLGYNIENDKNIVIRSTNNKYINNNSEFIIYKEEKEVKKGIPTYWGKKWKSHWWKINFREITQKGIYKCIIKNGDKLIEECKFEIGSNILWKKSFQTVAIEQLQERVKAKFTNVKEFGKKYVEGGGWLDCGGRLREVNSHATTLIAIFDALEFSKEKLTSQQTKDLREQAKIGIEYLAFCQDKAVDLGNKIGTIIHEWPDHETILTGDIAKSAVSFARAGRILNNKSYIKRAKNAFNYLAKYGPIHKPKGKSFSQKILPKHGFDPIPYGAPLDSTHPNEWKTRDIVMTIWAGVELFKSGEVSFKKKTIELTDKLINRQINKKLSEGKFFGHFKAFESKNYSEKAWEHHHMGYDAGGTFPHYILPIIEMTKIWSNDKNVNKWKECINNFAYGYFLPACKSNPFKLLPIGYFKGEGILTFSGLWHGINGAYGSGACLALNFYKFTNDTQFEDIAIGNLQWIAGLNSGITENNRYLSRSMIYGIGDKFIGSWTKIPGTICNGFESDNQFQFTIPKAENDGPWVFTDEGWITHSGGWISALSILNN